MREQRRKHAGLVVVAVLAAALAACSDSTATDSPNRKDALDRAVAELVAMPGGPPGAIVVVQRGATRSVHAAGVSALGSDAAPGVDEHMRIASTAKAFSGAAALALVDKGVMSLDDTIAERLADLPQAWGAITLRQLLNHTSGMPNYTTSPSFGEAVSATPDKAAAPADLLGYVADEPLVFPPGTQYTYSNSENIAVGLMIEAATGQDYADVLAEQVFKPLGLDETSLPDTTAMPEPFIHGYQLTADGKPDDYSTVFAAGWAWASGGIVSTPGDLNDFIRGYVGGDLFGDEVRDQQQGLFIPAGPSDPPGPGENSASMGLFRYRTECGTVYGHTGSIFGYTQFAVATPDGRRSATASISLQRDEHAEGQAGSVFEALQRLELAAICYALD